MVDCIEVQAEQDACGDDWFDNHYASPILDAKYKKGDISEVVQQQTCVIEDQKKDLKALLSKYQQMSRGSLGVYPHRKFHSDVEPDVKPVQSMPYSVPRIHLKVFKRELRHLVEIGV